MARDKVDGLLVTTAKRHSGSIGADVPMRDIANAVMAGNVAIIKNAFDPAEMRRLRTMVSAAEIPYCEPTFGNDTRSWRDRREVWVTPDVEVSYEASFIAVANPEDPLGQAMQNMVERLAGLWRDVTGHDHDLVPKAGRRALRPWAMYYPAGGGSFGWHEHRLEPTRVGLILAMSQIGVDFRCGGTEFKTPFGLVDVAAHHDIGDVCMFRYDLPHCVAAVDPERELTWDGSGRWTFLIQGDPRPIEAEVAAA